MRTTADAHLDQLVEAIKNYLSAHPGAADSELGIAQWWLHDGERGVTVDEVQRALLRLQQFAVMEVVDVAGVGRVWRATARPGHTPD